MYVVTTKHVIPYLASGSCHAVLLAVGSKWSCNRRDPVAAAEAAHRLISQALSQACFFNLSISVQAPLVCRTLRSPIAL
jgi:hypothetical protein